MAELNKPPFYDYLRAKFGKLDSNQVKGFEAILERTKGLPLSWQAYILATAWHEVGGTMRPVEEAHYLGSKAKAFRARLRYFPWYGRGFVQTTWERNYKWLDAEAAKRGLIKAGDILANPDLAMRMDIAVLALVEGMVQGIYDAQGKKMKDRLPAKGMATRAQYINARYLVNIQDKADLIEDYAQIFERALRYGGMS